MQPVPRDVPVRLRQDVLSRGGERGRVRALGAGDEAAGDAVRQPEQLREPPCGDLLPPRRPPATVTTEKPFWSHAAREPVRRDGGRKRAAEDEAEVAARLRADDAGLAGGDQLRDDVDVLPALIRERAAECLDELVERGLRVHGSVVERLVELRRVVGRVPEEVVDVAHVARTVPATLAAASRIAPAERSTSSSLVRQFETEIRIAALPCQTVPESQHVPSSCTPFTVASRQRVVVAEADEHLVEHDLVQDLDAGLGAEQLREARAWSQQRSTIAAMPSLPSARIAA